jgi:hypothetical protein
MNAFIYREFADKSRRRSAQIGKARIDLLP